MPYSFCNISLSKHLYPPYNLTYICFLWWGLVIMRHLCEMYFRKFPHDKIKSNVVGRTQAYKQVKVWEQHYIANSETRVSLVPLPLATSLLLYVLLCRAAAIVINNNLKQYIRVRLNPGCIRVFLHGSASTA